MCTYVYVYIHVYIELFNTRLQSCLAPQVYASGKDVVIVDGHLNHIQTVQGDMTIRALHCSEGAGKIAVAWGSDVVIFNPEPHESELSEASTTDLSAPLLNVVSLHSCFSAPASQGGTGIIDFSLPLNTA